MLSLEIINFDNKLSMKEMRWKILWNWSF